MNPGNGVLPFPSSGNTLDSPPLSLRTSLADANIVLGLIFQTLPGRADSNRPMWQFRGHENRIHSSLPTMRRGQDRVDALGLLSGHV
jgi:hypothetical protein